MAAISIGGQSPGTPELVEILKRLNSHRDKEWNRIFGDELPDNLNKFCKGFLEALRADDCHTAEDLLCRFVDAANVECSDDSRRQMLSNLASIMEVRLGALASGDTKFNSQPAELGPEAEKAFDLWNRIHKERYTPEESAAYWRHPLRWLCRQLEERLGITRENLEIASYRLRSELGLRGMKPLVAPNGKVDDDDRGQPDWLWMLPKLKELDRDGTTARLWQTLLADFPHVLVDAGLAPAATKEQGEGNGGAAQALIAPAVKTAPDPPVLPIPVQWLTNWREILVALSMKDNKEDQDKVKKLNKTYSGPIVIPKQGAQPKVDKLKLLEWGNGLEQKFRDEKQRQKDTQATAAAQHPYGQGGIVAPDISGGVKKRRDSAR